MRSDRIKKGVNAAPQRSLLLCTGTDRGRDTQAAYRHSKLEERYSSGTHEYR